MKKPASRYINQIISLREQKVSWADIAKKLRMSTHVTYKVPSLQMAFYNHWARQPKKVKVTKTSKLRKAVERDTNLLVQALSRAPLSSVPTDRKSVV